MAFIQIIEYDTDRPEEFDRLEDEWLQATQGKRTTIRSVTCRDRDRPNR